MSTNRDDDVARAIRQRDVQSLIRMMFDERDDVPVVRPGFKTETELWDFKADCPKPGVDQILSWSEIAIDVLAFHNQRGGILVFGISNDFHFSGTSFRLDSKLFNDALRRFLGDRIWVEYHREFIQSDQKYLGVAVVPPRGPALERFRGPAPAGYGPQRFLTGDSAIRRGDSSQILKKADADDLARGIAVPTLGRVYAVDQPFFRILQPEYVEFVERRAPGEQLEAALSDPRTAITSLIGVGGTGKTALATWAALRAFEHKQFGFVVSITAKDRELTKSGIAALEPSLTSFEALLDNTLEVLGFPEVRQETVERKETEVRRLLEKSNGLLFVDNLETVDDARIITFLDDLPVGCRAITTSRRSSVRVAVRPVDVGPLTPEETEVFVATLAQLPGFGYVADLSKSERRRIGAACSGLPLAIRWILANCSSPSEALTRADAIKASGREGEELLEFCFRRAFESMSGPERSVMEVLSLFQQPVPTEAVLVGAGSAHAKLLDATEQLVADALVQRLFDPQRNDYTYTLLPLARTFVYSQVVRQANREEAIRRNLTEWFEARDIKDTDERLVVRELRQGKGAADSALLDLAQAAERRRDTNSAQDLYEQALTRNPGSWKAARLYAEFCRHTKNNTGEALRLYEQAAANAPRRGPDRALIFREWGMLLRDSGDPSATDLAIEKFETALAETPNDEMANHALAHMLDRKGHYVRVVQLLEPLLTSKNNKTRQMASDLLLRAYDKTGDSLKASQLRTASSGARAQ